MRTATIVLLVLACLYLASCATAPPPEPRVIHDTVEVPVPVPCSAKVDEPDLSAVDKAISSGADVFGLAQAYRSFYLAARPYIAGLKGALSACNGQTGGAK